MNYRKENGWRSKLFEIIFEADTSAGKLFDVLLIACILLSVGVVMLDSVESFQKDHQEALIKLEWTFTLLFTLEYFLRLICTNNPLRYAGSFYGVVDLLAVLVQPRGAVIHERPRGHMVITQIGPALQAGLAPAASGHEGQDYLVARPDRVDAGSDAIHRAGALVSKHGRKIDPGVPVDEMPVAAADSGSANLHQDFTRLGIVQLHVFHHQGLLRLV